MAKDIYKNSRVCYVIEETIHYLITILITGAYLAKLTSELGFSDSMTALLGSFVNLGCIFQLLALAIFKNGRVKRKVTVLYTISHCLFIMLYIVPFFKINPVIKATLFIVFQLGGYFIFNIVSSPRTNWFMALVPDKSRGKFTAFKEAVSLICGIVFKFTMGLLIDHYDTVGNTSASFTVCGIVIFIFMISHTAALIVAKEKEPTMDESTVSNNIKTILTDKSILPIILISTLWALCYGISTPFLSTYQIKELGFSMTFVAWLSVINASVRIISSMFLGRYADRNSFAKMLKICYLIVAASFLAMTFTTPSNGHIMYTVYEVFMAAAMGGINSAEINLVFDSLSPDKRKNTLSIKQIAYGLCGFTATLIATPLVNYVQASDNTLLGIPVYAQQVLSFVSFILVIILLIYVDKVMVIKKHVK